MLLNICILLVLIGVLFFTMCAVLYIIYCMIWELNILIKIMNIFVCCVFLPL